MSTSYLLKTESGGSVTVSFSVTQNNNAEKPYGICAILKGDDGKSDKAYADCRFITYDEAQKTIELLCKHQVTPCTLCDIL